MFYKARYKLEGLAPEAGQGFYYGEFEASNDIHAGIEARKQESKIPILLEMPGVKATLERVFELREIDLSLSK